MFSDHASRDQEPAQLNKLASIYSSILVVAPHFVLMCRRKVLASRAESHRTAVFPCGQVSQNR
jgi:hypothetical protein